MNNEFETLLARYWDLAYLEGKSGLSMGDKANEVLAAIRKLPAQPRTLPDVLTRDDGETPEYIAGWNDALQAMRSIK